MIDLTKIRHALEGFMDGLPLKLDLNKHPRGHGQVALVRDGYSLKELPGTKRGRRTHDFFDVASLAAWLKRHAGPKQTEILVGKDQVVAGLDPKADEGDLVTAQLLVHPRMKRWIKVFGAELGQVALHEFIFAASEDVGMATTADNKEIAYGPILADNLRKLSMVKEEHLDTDYDELGYARFSGSSNNVKLTATIPPRFPVRVPFYLDVRDAEGGEIFYDFEVLLRVSTRNKQPHFTLLCPSLDVIRHNARLDAVAYLRRLLGDGWLVGLGDFGHQSVPDVRE